MAIFIAFLQKPGLVDLLVLAVLTSKLNSMGESIGTHLFEYIVLSMSVSEGQGF